MSTLTISGSVIRKADNTPIAKFYIEVWDKEKISDEVLGSTITDGNGAFTLRFEESYLNELFKDQLPEVYFKIYAGRTLLASTENNFVVNLHCSEEPIIVPVDYTPAKERKQLGGKTNFIVRGTILQSNYLPAAGYTIEVTDKGVLSDLRLAIARTNEKGAFETSFTADVFADTGKQTPDVFLKITLDKKESHQTSVVYNAPSVLEFKEVIGGAGFPKQSEFEVIAGKLQPLLRRVPVQNIKMDEQNNPFKLLSEKTCESEQKIKRFITAHQLSFESKLAPEFYYALLQGQLAAEPSVLTNQFFRKDLQTILSQLKISAIAGCYFLKQ